MPNKWTKEEIEFIKNNYEKMSDAEISEYLGTHSEGSVTTKRKRLGCKRSNKKYDFQDVLDAFSKTDYELLSTEDEYKDCLSKIRYICPRHRDKGEQSIALNHLLNGEGCFYCGRDITGKKKTIEHDENEIRKLCEEKDFQYIGLIKRNKKTYVRFICNKHTILGEQEVEIHNLKRNKGCKYCRGKEFPEWYVIKKMQEVNPDLEICGEYVNLTTKIKCRCKIHDVISYKTPQDILKGQGCYKCGHEKLLQARLKDFSEIEKQLKEKHPELEIVGEYVDSKTKVKMYCKKHDHYFFDSVRKAMTRKSCCEKDERFHNEKYIGKLLESWGYKVKRQKKFKGCKDKRKLPFDIYLEDFNTLIEYDGEQHYKPIYGMKSFNKTIYHDKIKNEFCKLNHINLIRIPYWKFDDIEYFLFDELVKIGVIEEIKRA